MKDFVDYLTDLENAVSTLQPTGKIILAGDVNVHLMQSNQASGCERQLRNCIHCHQGRIQTLIKGGHR